METGGEREPAARPVAQRRRLRRLLLVACSVLVALLALEGALRVVLFAEWMRDTGLARRLRREEHFAALTDPDYWKLEVLFRRPAQAAKTPRTFDARTGWLPAEVDPKTFAHADEATLGERRPVLLFGDSFAQCVTRAGACWQELLEQSELAPRFALLNYGVGGYGLDQAVILARLALERFHERDPVVVMAILVDDDLDRCMLSLRNYPKPWFTLEGDELVQHAPAATNPLAFVRADPPAIRSYLWRGLLFGTGLVARETAARWCAAGPSQAACEVLSRRLLSSFREELEARGIAYFFLLFHGEGEASSEVPLGWEESFLYREFEAEHAPFVSSKRWLRARAKEQGLHFADFYFQDEPGRGHFDELGNRVAFEALRQGLLGSFEPYAYLAER